MEQANKNTKINEKYEVTDGKALPLLYSGIGLTVFTIAAILLMFALFRWLEIRESRLDTDTYYLAEISRPVPATLLQINARQELAELRAAETHTLTTYGWVDEDARIVRVPVERAIEIALQKKTLERAQ